MSFPPPCDCSVSGRRASSLPSAVGAPEAALLTLRDCRGLGPERREASRKWEGLGTDNAQVLRSEEAAVDISKVRALGSGWVDASMYGEGTHPAPRGQKLLCVGLHQTARKHRCLWLSSVPFMPQQTPGPR